MKLKPSDLIDAEARHGGARHRYHQQPHQPARRCRIRRCSSTAAPGADYEILVQLPGVDDPARVKEFIGTAAVLEITDVKDGPFPSREAALAQHGGVLPLNTKLVKMQPRGGARGRTVVPGRQDAR